MQNWSSWQGMGVSPMSGLVSTSCAAALDRFPLVTGTQVHCDQQSMQFCSLLGLFAPVSKRSSQGARCSTFTLETVPQYYPHATETIATLEMDCLIIALKIFLEGCRSSWIFLSPDHNLGEFYLIIHSDQTTKLSKAWAVTFLILPSFLRHVFLFIF